MKLKTAPGIKAEVVFSFISRIFVLSASVRALKITAPVRLFLSGLCTDRSRTACDLGKMVADVLFAGLERVKLPYFLLVEGLLREVGELELMTFENGVQEEKGRTDIG